MGVRVGWVRVPVRNFLHNRNKLHFKPRVLQENLHLHRDGFLCFIYLFPPAGAAAPIKVTQGRLVFDPHGPCWRRRVEEAFVLADEGSRNRLLIAGCSGASLHMSERRRFESRRSRFGRRSTSEKNAMSSSFKGKLKEFLREASATPDIRVCPSPPAPPSSEGGGRCLSPRFFPFVVF